LSFSKPKSVTCASYLNLSLFAILDSHLAMEDNVVYLLLLKSSDEKVKNLPMKFPRVINIIGKVLVNYKIIDLDAISIPANPSLFIL